jgi:hypothetical protein
MKKISLKHINKFYIYFIKEILEGNSLLDPVPAKSPKILLNKSNSTPRDLAIQFSQFHFNTNTHSLSKL